LKRYGIKPSFFLQFGYLGETIEDIQLTLDMVKRYVPSDIGISVSYPLPGTKFYEKVKNQLGEKTNWTDSDEMALMFQNTYKPEFYKQLHSYVHMLFRKATAGVKAQEILKNPSVFNLKDAYLAAKWPYYLVREVQQRKLLYKLL
jgi:radical SAM superfamily enzyme YgiQ (UPF0313 family)